MSKQSNIIFAVKEPFTAAKEPWQTFAITKQFELDEVIEISQATSVVFKNASQIERMEITATGWVATIVKRGITQEWDSIIEDVNLRKNWGDWDIGYITQLAFDQVKLDWDNTFTWTNTFDGINITDTNNVNFWDNAYIKTIDNWNNLLFKDWSNSETNLSTLTAAAWSDRKVSVSTNDLTTWTLEEKIIAWDWLKRVINNPNWSETRTDSIDLNTTNWLLIDSWKLSVNYANEWVTGTTQKANDTEVGNWESVNKYVTPEQLLFNIIVASDNVKSESLSISQITVSDVGSSTPYNKAKSFDIKWINNWWSLRITWTVEVVDNNDIDFWYNINSTSWGNVAVINDVQSNTPTNFSVDIPSVSLNDNIILGFQSNNPNWVVCKLSNVQVKFDYVSTKKWAIFN